jgi:type II secretory pathway component PulC
MHRSLVAAALVSLASLSAACGSPPPKTAAQDTKPADEPKAAPTTTAAAVAGPVTQLKRAQVRAMIRSGLGVFFQNVLLDDYPVMRNNKFYGFKLKALNPDWNVGLAPGDVVTRVNGMSIEHPEEADAAMRALDKAPALRVDYEREGKPAVLELPIVD